MWPFSSKGPSGFSWYSTAEEVTQGLDGSGLTAIVTGASSGIGAETARVLALHGVHVVMAVRSLSSGNVVKEAILKETPSAKVDVMELDLASMESVRKFASEYNSRELPLSLLINNAGVMGTPFTLSQDGIELQFATNHIGHFLLTHLLLENMKNTARESKIEGRIVNVSSQGHMFSYREGIRFDRINEQSDYSSLAAYGQSKLANILHANELTRRFKEDGVDITANSLHPGSIITNLLRYHSIIDCKAVEKKITKAFSLMSEECPAKEDIKITPHLLFQVLARTLGKLVLKNAQQGAATTCYVALHPDVKGVSGKYFDNSNIGNPSSKAKDAELAKKLWDFSMELIS